MMMNLFTNDIYFSSNLTKNILLTMYNQNFMNFIIFYIIIVVFLYMILGTFSRDITVRHVPKKYFNSLSQLKKPCHGEKA